MKKLDNKRLQKVGKNIKTIGMLIGIATMLVLIFMWSPKCTEVTKNFATWLYELDEEYITRFWTILLSLISVLVLVFFDKLTKNENK